MWTQVYRIEILQGWSAAKTTHCDSGYEVTIETYLLPDFYLEWKMPYLLLPSLTDFFVLMLCNLHIRSQALNEQQEQEENSDFTFWMERAWSLCFHGNVTMDISWNFGMSVTTVQSFTSMKKRSSEIIIFHFLWFYIILCPHCDIRSHLICINQYLQ